MGKADKRHQVGRASALHHRGVQRNVPEGRALGVQATGSRLVVLVEAPPEEDGHGVADTPRQRQRQSHVVTDGLQVRVSRVSRGFGGPALWSPVPVQLLEGEGTPEAPVHLRDHTREERLQAVLAARRGGQLQAEGHQQRLQDSSGISVQNFE